MAFEVYITVSRSDIIDDTALYSNYSFIFGVIIQALEVEIVTCNENKITPFHSQGPFVRALQLLVHYYLLFPLTTFTTWQSFGPEQNQ